MNEHIDPTEGQIESGEARGAEEQALDDATFEPEAFVEQKGDYQQAEAIQANLVNVAENVATTGSEAHDGNKAAPINLTDVQQEGKMGKDPLTGEEFGGKEGSSEDESSERIFSAKEAGLAESQSQVRGDLDHATASSEGSGKDEATPINPPGADHANVDDLGPEHLTPDNLPEQAKDFAGEGAHGMIEKGVAPGAGLGVDHGLDQKVGPGKHMGPGTGAGTSGSGPDRIGNQPGMPMPGGKEPGGSTHGYGPGHKGGGQSSSGGGPPVGSYGAGSYGDDDGQGHGVPNKGSKQGSAPWISKEDEDTINEGLSNGDISKEDAEKLQEQLEQEALDYYQAGGQVGNTIDGGSPMPYTGSGHWGGEPDPDLVGGVDKESGHLTPIVSIGGKSAGGSGGWGPDDLDDSGKYYGGIYGSAGRPNNPDNPDYYTPNVLEEASKTVKKAK